MPAAKSKDELLPEYRFDYRKAKPNRFAARLKQKQMTITLDPDVSKVFNTSASVNQALRALISAMPETTKPKTVMRKSQLSSAKPKIA